MLIFQLAAHWNNSYLLLSFTTLYWQQPSHNSYNQVIHGKLGLKHCLQVLTKIVCYLRVTMKWTAQFVLWVQEVHNWNFGQTWVFSRFANFRLKGRLKMWTTLHLNWHLFDYNWLIPLFILHHDISAAWKCEITHKAMRNTTDHSVLTVAFTPLCVFSLGHSRILNHKS